MAILAALELENLAGFAGFTVIDIRAKTAFLAAHLEDSQNFSNELEILRFAQNSADSKNIAAKSPPRKIF